MRFQFNAHNLIVYGREGDEFLVSDPVFDHPVRIKAEDLQNARFAKGTLAPKGFHLLSRPGQSRDRFGKAIRKAIRRTVRMMLHAPVPFIGVKGIHYMARQIERLKGGDPRYARLFLGHIVRMQEEIGTGGGGFRFMYAAFLQEAGGLLGSAPLGEASRMMTEAGDLWRQFALACARACKSKTADLDAAEIVQRLLALRRAGEARLYAPQVNQPVTGTSEGRIHRFSHSSCHPSQDSCRNLSEWILIFYQPLCRISRGLHAGHFTAEGTMLNGGGGGGTIMLLSEIAKCFDISELAIIICAKLNT